MSPILVHFGCIRRQQEYRDGHAHRQNDLHEIYEFLNFVYETKINKIKNKKQRRIHECAVHLISCAIHTCDELLHLYSPSAECLVSTISILPTNWRAQARHNISLAGLCSSGGARSSASGRSFVQVHIIEVNWSDWLYNCWKYAFFHSFLIFFLFF